MEKKKAESYGMTGVSQQQSLGYGISEDLAETPGHDLHKRLESRHVVMIALGGALGTGLLVGT